MRVDLLMTLSVMFLDVLKLCRLSKCRYVPVQSPQPIVERRIAASNVPDVALEMLDIDWVKADDGGVQADISLCDLRAEVVRCCVLCKVFLSTIEGSEEGLNGFLIGFLSTGTSLESNHRWWVEERKYVAKPDL